MICQTRERVPIVESYRVEDLPNKRERAPIVESYRVEDLPNKRESVYS